MNKLSDIKNALIKRDGLKCAVTGEIVKNSDELLVDYVIPRIEGGSDDLDNLQLVKKRVNSFLVEDEKRIEILTKELGKRQDELANRERELFEREQTYRREIDHQKKQLEEIRLNIQKEQSKREAFYEGEIKSLREDLLKQKEVLAMKEVDVAQMHAHLSKVTQEKEREIALAFEELEHEKEKYREESRKQIESRSTAYVQEALESLDNSAKKFHAIGRNWSIAGSLALVAGVATGLYFGVLGLTPIDGKNDIQWSHVTFFAFRGVLVIGLFIALAKYCFTYGQSFTHEAIKNSERKHAINFGKFYLETYGADAQWSQIKEAFEHWNINSTSAFSGNDSDKFDPKIFEKVIQLAETVQRIGKGKTDDKDLSPKSIT